VELLDPSRRDLRLPFCDEIRSPLAADLVEGGGGATVKGSGRSYLELDYDVLDEAAQAADADTHDADDERDAQAVAEQVFSSLSRYQSGVAPLADAGGAVHPDDEEQPLRKKKSCFCF
jgi:hypothetical protein